MTALVADLTAESADFRSLLDDLDGESWRMPTPATGWSVADQVAHLADVDTLATLSATAPGAFVVERHRREQAALDTDAIVAAHRHRAGAEVVCWFDEARGRLLDALAELPPDRRVPWFGPPMSAASSLTARIMETWAHGQDVADALGIRRVPSARLRHVAHLGIAARAYSYAAHARTAPAVPVRVELTGPACETWTWGPEDATDRVDGPALDFALLVTRRRHPDDLALSVQGRFAADWVRIAQAFAGPPGSGRSPGMIAVSGQRRA